MKTIMTFENFNNSVDPDIAEELKSCTSMEELDKKIDQYNLNKGDLMKIAYDNDTRNVDSAIPQGLWAKLEEFGGTYWFVMDYKSNTVGGQLVHLGEKILGQETDWNEKLRQ
jgi:hypothetical protein